MENQFIEFIGNHILLSTAWFAIGILILISINKGSAAAVSSQQLVNLINREEALVIDVRNSAEFKKNHIAGSKNIQLTKLSEQMSKLENWKNKPIVVVCNAGVQASSACTQLKKNGFEQVFKLKGGIQTWLADSLPLTKG
jgi:rhodanese-related sulfurtransferase